MERKRIKHVPSRKKNPQINGKLERWFQEYIKHRKRFETPEEFKNRYNKRIHGALNLEIKETPEAFIRRLGPESSKKERKNIKTQQTSGSREKYI